MATLAKSWAGKIYGTNTGNFFLEIETLPKGLLTGTLSFMDTLLGLSVYQLEGSFNGSVVKFRGDPAHAKGPEGVQHGDIDVTATLTPQGNLSGQWSSSLGTRGTFEGFPHDPLSPSAITGPPEQLYTSTAAIGPVRIYSEDLWQIIELVRKDFVVGRPVVTYTLRGNEATKYLEDFRKEAGSIEEINRFKIVVQEHEAHNINRVVTVDLTPFGENEVRVQGIDETWVTGKAEATARLLRTYENETISTFRKLGINVHQLLFLAMLVAVPAIQLPLQRLAFVVGVVVLFRVLLLLNERFFPNVTIYLGKAEAKPLERLLPSVLSWTLGIVGSVIASLLYAWLTTATPATRP